MANLHRLQWIDARIRAGKYPNAGELARQFEISHRQALRDFEYLRDSLGAPLAYSAQHRGFYYTAEAYVLPGPYMTESERLLLAQMAAYYSQAAAGPAAENPLYGEMARLLGRLAGQPGQNRPAASGMTHHVTPSLVGWRQSTAERMGPIMDQQQASRRETPARLHDAWNCYAGSAYGVLQAAGMCDLDFSQFMGLTGMAFHLIVHDTCHVSSVTVYPWWEEHKAALERIGILSDVHHTMPDAPTYDAACRRAVAAIRSAVDRGVGAVLWGVDTGEFGVVYGYDDEAGVLLADGVFRVDPNGTAPIPYAQAGRTFAAAPILHCQIPVERTPFDPDRAHREALSFYVSQMERETQRAAPEYKSGLAAYQAWERSLTAGDFEHWGLRYITSVYTESKQHAAAYLQHLAGGWNPGLAEAAGLLGRVAAVYSQMMSVLGQELHGPFMLDQPVAPEQAAALVPLVREAARLEEQALAGVKQALGRKEGGQ